MTEFVHSIVLFSGEDGLPLEFNIQHTVDKSVLKPMIEYGGGLCTLDDNAIHLVSPGTTVINVLPGAKLVSSRYIHDCVKQNYLLNMEDYKIEITELETSDISEEDSKNEDAEALSPPIVAELPGFPDNKNNVDCDIVAEPSFFPNKNNDDIVDCDMIAEPSVLPKKNNNDSSNCDIPEPSVFPNNDEIVECDAAEASLQKDDNVARDVIVEPAPPDNGDCDMEPPDSLSQSNTVSSSADAQVPQKSSPQNTSAEIFVESQDDAPDSQSQTVVERQIYIENLEKEIEQILLKPSPKSIQDKITLVKYICCVKKLPPAIVLQTLQNF